MTGPESPTGGVQGVRATGISEGGLLLVTKVIEAEEGGGGTLAGDGLDP